MKSILKRIGAIIRSAMSSVAHAVLVPVRLADGALGYVWKAIAGGTPPLAMDDIEEVAVDQATPASAPDDEARWLEIGLAVQAQACALAEHRKLPMDPIGCWLRTLSEPALVAVMTGDPVSIGKHVCGVAQMRTEHEIRIPHPDEARDRKRVEAIFEDRRRAMLREDDRRVKREREAPTLIPSIMPTF